MSWALLPPEQPGERLRLTMADERPNVYEDRKHWKRARIVLMWSVAKEVRNQSRPVRAGVPVGVSCGPGKEDDGRTDGSGRLAGQRKDDQ